MAVKSSINLSPCKFNPKAHSFHKTTPTNRHRYALFGFLVNTNTHIHIPYLPQATRSISFKENCKKSLNMYASVTNTVIQKFVLIEATQHTRTLATSSTPSMTNAPQVKNDSSKAINCAAEVSSFHNPRTSHNHYYNHTRCGLVVTCQYHQLHGCSRLD